MKQGWERKKLGEVIKEYSVRNKNGAEYPVYSVTNSQGFCRDYFSKDVASKEKSTYKIVPKGCFAYNPSRINVGSVDWQRNEEYVIVSPLYVVFETLKEINNDFLLYYLKSATTMLYINNLATGTVRANLKFDILSSFPIVIPPLSIQERIVEELDCISGIIEKKKEQLKELDALAQSIFYTMFGENEERISNWKTCRVGDVYRFQYGKGNKIPENKGKYPCYGSNGQVGFHIEYNAEDSPIIGHIGAYAGIVNWGAGKHYVTYNGVICNLKNNSFNAVYAYHMLKAQNYMAKVRGGAAQPFVSYDLLNEPAILVPPLPLQQEFAKKIEAIEKQKELIIKSIGEVETLLASRMQEYFE